MLFTFLTFLLFERFYMYGFSEIAELLAFIIMAAM